MEEILSSIKRIIAEDAERLETPVPHKARSRRDVERESHRRAVVASMAGDSDEGTPSYVDEVLELTDEMPKVGKVPEAEPVAPVQHKAQEESVTLKRKPSVAQCGEDAAMGIVSVESEVAARTSLAALSSLVVSASGPGEHTLEGLVREMLRPMLKEWLDANLPTLVEGMVAKEIARITGRPL